MACRFKPWAKMYWIDKFFQAAGLCELEIVISSLFQDGTLNEFTWQVWEEGFRSRLFIRPKSQHGKCSICLRHKAVVKKLRRNLPARAAQMKQYQLHLCKQYSDRQIYWQNRSHARLADEKPDGTTTLCLAVDSIDHSKFAWPRSCAMSAKEFGQFIRPCLSVTMALLHGKACLVYVSESHVSHDSSWTCDLICHVLEVVRQEFGEVDLRRCSLHCHGDNASKELKNNSVCRLLSALVGCRRLHSCSLNTLQSGHSHEDIDQAFSSLAGHIANEAELHTPAAFIESIQRWLSKASTRPTEPVRRVFRVDKNRAWSFGFFRQNCMC